MILDEGENEMHTCTQEHRFLGYMFSIILSQSTYQFEGNQKSTIVNPVSTPKIPNASLHWLVLIPLKGLKYIEQGTEMRK